MDPGPGTQGPNGPWAWDPGSQWTMGQGPRVPNGPVAVEARDPGPNGPAVARRCRRRRLTRRRREFIYIYIYIYIY